MALFFPAMKRILVRPVSDNELRAQLEARDTILFVGEQVSWQDIERQVERLGFGELYIVSATQARGTGAPRIS
jgi:hypothetical protein